MAKLMKTDFDLIDCYRLAVDFGRPAAEKAIAIINATMLESEELGDIAHTDSQSDLANRS